MELVYYVTPMAQSMPSKQQQKNAKTAQKVKQFEKEVRRCIPKKAIGGQLGTRRISINVQ